MVGCRNWLARKVGLKDDHCLSVAPRSRCGSQLACESGLTDDRSLTVTPRSRCGSRLACESGLTDDHSLTVTPRSKCGSWLACESGLTDDRSLTVTPRSKCGSWLACEGGLTADLDGGSDRVHIRYLEEGCYGFRPYGGSLWKSRNAGPAQSKQRVLAPTLGTSPRLGVPVIRQVFWRLNRHPCRFTPQVPVELRPACLMGRFRSKADQEQDQERLASHLG